MENLLELRLSVALCKIECIVGKQHKIVVLEVAWKNRSVSVYQASCQGAGGAAETWGLMPSFKLRLEKIAPRRKLQS